MNIILFEQLEQTNHLPADDSRSRHIRKILHLGIGDCFSCGIVNGPAGTATISCMDDGIDFTFEPEDEHSSVLYPVMLLVSQVRPICMKRILREAVSLGVSTIMINGADLSEKSYAKASFYLDGTYKSVLLDGAMQAAKTGVSKVVFADSLDVAVHQLPSCGNLIMLDNVIGAAPLSQWKNKEDHQPVVLAIGPERGYSERERQLLLQKGFQPKTLGSRVLRTETACSAGIAVLLGRLGYL
ncbi:MAG: RsmE family RNA methyltransferase [Spirochaetia bacterium]|nr:RsmE family RNA methyltransferase [Spirochaetia bacterium]